MTLSDSDGLVCVAKSLLSLDESRRLGQAKAVDALLDVADAEKIARATNQRQDRILHLVDVLVFIDQHVCELFLHHPRNRRRGERLGIAVAQGAQRQPFQVGKIDAADRALRRGVAPAEGVDQV